MNQATKNSFSELYDACESYLEEWSEKWEGNNKVMLDKVDTIVEISRRLRNKVNNDSHSVILNNAIDSLHDPKANDMITISCLIQVAAVPNSENDKNPLNY